jgi:hypothetical protein
MKTALKLSLISIVIIQLLISCEPITYPQSDSIYRGTITYSLPSINQTTPASRTFSGDSVRWWDAPVTSGAIYPTLNGYSFSQIVIEGHSNCADSITLTHSGTGVFSPDSLIESGSVVYYRRVGSVEITEIGTFCFKGKRKD